MTNITFTPNKVIEPKHCELEIISAESIDEYYGPQLAIKVRVTSGEHVGHTFKDYPNRDKYTGDIKQGSKAWDIFSACLGGDFYKRDVELADLVGCRFLARVSRTKTGSRNKLEHGTIGPVPPEAKDQASKPPGDVGFEDMFSNLPF